MTPHPGVGKNEGGKKEGLSLLLCFDFIETMIRNSEFPSNFKPILEHYQRNNKYSI